jgi:predicted nucleic acid-binding protein
MADYLLDTNHASPLVTLHHPVRQRVLAALAAGDFFAVCVPALTETLYGIGIVPRAIQNRAIWEQLQPQLICHIPDAADAARAADLQILLRRRGRQLATIDALIAVTALRYDLTLLTTDGDFRAVPSLQLENWMH